MRKSISIHNCAVNVCFTADAFSPGMELFVTLPQANHRCSPVHQVLSTGSVNINKNLLPLGASSYRGSASSHANAGPAQTACKAPCRPTLQPASLQTGEHSDGQLWLWAVCTQTHRPHCVALLMKNRKAGSKRHWNL